MTDTTRLALAEARANGARERLNGTLASLQRRLDPRTVARNAFGGIADNGVRAMHNGVEAVRNNPAKVAGAAALIAAFLARHRLGALFGRARDDDDNNAQPASARRVRAMKPRPAPARRE